MAVKSDVRSGHDIAYVTRGHASGCAGAMAYYTRTGDPPGTWEGRGTIALGLSGTVEAAAAERLYQEGVAPGGERIIRHAAPKTGKDRAAAEAAAIARYREKHPFASAIDTPLPVPPSRVHLMLKYKASWVVPAIGRRDQAFQEYPELSIEDWHRQNELWVK